MIEKNENDLKNYVKGTVSKKQFAELEQGLESADVAKTDKIKSANLKKPSVTTALSSVFGLFGGGSFYLGQIKRGIIKIVFNVVVPVLIICIFLVAIAPNFQKYADQATAYDEEVVQVLQTNINGLLSELSEDTLGDHFEQIESLADKAENYYLLTVENDGTLIGEVIKNKLYKDLSLIDTTAIIAEYLKTAVGSDNYTVVYENIQSAYNTASSLSSSLLSKATSWQKVHDVVFMYFLIITIIDAVVIAAYWVGEVFRDREKCHKMNYESIKRCLIGN